MAKGKKLNKEDLVNQIAKNGLTKVEANEQLNNVLKGLADVAADMGVGDKLTLVGYLTMELVHREERKGRNPRTKEDMIIPAKDVIKFKTGKKFQRA